jgi:hypothetical protein
VVRVHRNHDRNRTVDSKLYGLNVLQVYPAVEHWSPSSPKRLGHGVAATSTTVLDKQLEWRRQIIRARAAYTWLPFRVRWFAQHRSLRHPFENIDHLIGNIVMEQAWEFV